jgi:hypothetical protein
MLLRQPLDGIEVTFQGRELVVVSPDGVDGQHRPWGRQVDELDAARAIHSASTRMEVATHAG